MAKRSGGSHGGRNRLKLALYAAINELRETDGRTSGLKFNKLIYDLYFEFQGSQYAFDLPHRWYLYGAVVDAFEVRQLITFDHPEDEFTTNVSWLGRRPPTKETGEQAYSEYLTTATNFSKKYSLEDRYDKWDMLRNHYKHAPLDFQRSFLEWEIFNQKVLSGYEYETSGEALKLLERLESTYPEEIEPRLSPAFRRLANVVKHRLTQRRPNDRSVLGDCQDWLWSYWDVFCDFLSIKYNETISSGRLESYRRHAEAELVAYKRNLQHLLEEYWRENPPETYDSDRLRDLKILVSKDMNDNVT